MGGFSIKQQDFLDHATHRWNIKSGATRSGKTYLDYYVIPLRIRRLAGKEGLTLILGNTKGTLQRNIIEPLQAIWGTGLVSDIRSDNTAILFGEKCYCLGADKVNQVNRIRGMSVKYCYGDEVVTWHPDVFEMLKSRMDKEYSCFDGTCNPEGPNHWFKSFLESDADIYQQQYTIYDNPYLPAEVIANLEREYTGTVFFDRYIRGLWVAAEGLIYRQFADNPTRWIKRFPGKMERDKYLADVDFVSVGVDFGGNRSLTTFVATAVHRGYSKLTVLQDHHIAGGKGEIDADRVNREFIAFVRRLQNDFPSLRIKYCFADSEAQYLINGLRKAIRAAGLPLQIGDSAKYEIVQRIICTTTLLNQNRLFLLDGCDLVKGGLESAVWDADHPDKDIRLDNFSTDIDILDAFEYSWERFMKKLIPDR
ncbi:PBSX family phage terminase large subunit [Anaerotruncus sp. AF02-27]|uniref:terminase large subunit domain-containing protein n=1 Tax=Anaerotruncus TaxID=244127 RepID=UPI000E49BBC8|nr:MULTISPECIES: terminase family protein [Anaerotruncus]RGX53783.1 PBSX family phage terminase large subunit [Anaerotruncus sp. AF02-27]